MHHRFTLSYAVTVTVKVPFSFRFSIFLRTPITPYIQTDRHAFEFESKSTVHSDSVIHFDISYYYFLPYANILRLKSHDPVHKASPVGATPTQETCSSWALFKTKHGSLVLPSTS